MIRIKKLIIAGMLVLGMQAAWVRAEDAPKPPDLTAGGVKFLRMEDEAAVYEVGSGTYSFQSRLPETIK